MRIAERLNARKNSTVGFLCVALMLGVFSTAPVLAQDATVPQNDASRTGVSHPPTDPIVETDDLPPPAASPAKPSPAVPMPKDSSAAGAVIPASSTETYGAYVPYRAPGAEASAPQQSLPSSFDPDSSIVTAATAGQAQRRAINAVDPNDPDSGIVTRVVSPPGAVAEGTLIKARLRETLSTELTSPGSDFSATLSEPMMREGQVIVPAGAVLKGRVTYVRSGTRFNGGAAIHLEPRSISLPDGSAYIIRARVIDTGDWDKTKVDDEGTIEHRNDIKKTAAALGLSTGGGAAAGAMMGGAPGALIGAGIGAGAATIVWLKQDTQAELPKDLELVFSLTEPMSVTPLGAVQHAATAKTSGPSGGE
ncbi:MAG TPA: hypothetical protein VN612_04765 [Acidobacteriaceae bacterium]|nr:hypothetical protein [Acidobacteriaceae bacterium]